MAVTNSININANNSTKANSSKNTKKSSNSNFSTYVEKTSSKTKTYTYKDIFKAAAKKYNISQELLEAVALTESSFNANATSYCGAQGIMQLMPATAKSLGVNDAYNPIENIMGGAKYLSQMLKKYNGDVSLTLAAYNGGPGNVAKHNGVPSFCQSYVNKVQNYLKKGVTVPNKTITVSSNSSANKIMEQYTNISSNNSLNSSKNTNDKNTTNSKETTTATSLNKKINSINTNEKLLSKISSYEELYTYASNEYNVPKEILKAISYTQSGFKENAISSSGAIGLMQLMPSTAAELGVTNPYNPIENVLGGAKYLSQLLDRYNGNITYAIAAYSAGMGNVDSYNGVPPFAQNFVNKVISLSKKGVAIPNIELSSSLFSNNQESNSKKHNNNEETQRKKLIDFQI